MAPGCDRSPSTSSSWPNTSNMLVWVLAILPVCNKYPITVDVEQPQMPHLSRALIFSGDSTRDSSIAGLGFDCTSVNGIMEALSAAPCYSPAWKDWRNTSTGTCAGIKWLHPRSSRGPGHPALCQKGVEASRLGLGTSIRAFVHSKDPFSNTDSQPVAATAPEPSRGESLGFFASPQARHVGSVGRSVIGDDSQDWGLSEGRLSRKRGSRSLGKSGLGHCQRGVCQRRELTITSSGEASYASGLP